MQPSRVLAIGAHRVSNAVQKQARSPFSVLMKTSRDCPGRVFTSWFSHAMQPQRVLAIGVLGAANTVYGYNYRIIRDCILMAADETYQHAAGTAVKEWGMIEAPPSESLLWEAQ
ncbi:hypothetical protein NDU88_003456 [Pleurodeles waltl]|uniref:Uncharacterized protein n=1 Tax=Pleurodeles waltl TaxID=8319 RepID=A0AAV7KYI3_PLEWA|nr:hypothetical protein NDU88_003456 [Pleurodeles waltl]